MTSRHLRIVVCGAGPASDVAQLITTAHERSWTASVTATETALDFIDPSAIEELTKIPVRSSYQSSDASRRALPSVDAMIIAPATYNTVNKIARGIADSYTLVSAAELIGRDVPTVVVPFVNAALAARAPFERAVTALRQEGVRVLFGPDDHWEPHPPGSGADRRKVFPWGTAFQVAEQLTRRNLHR